MPDGSREALVEARRELAALARQRQQRSHDVVTSERQLRDLERVAAANDPRIRDASAAHAERLRELEATRAESRQARERAAERLAQWLPDSPEQEWGHLQTDYPALLLPVRLETKFGSEPRGGPVLRVRIYPDAVFVDSHDRELTVDERDAGYAYWRAVWNGAEIDAWRELVRDFAAPRAAWCVRALEPENLAELPAGEPVFPDVELRPGAWARAPRATLLPDRWLLVGYREGTEVARAWSRPVHDSLAFGFDPHASSEEMRVVGNALELDEDLAWAVDFERAEEVGMALKIPLSVLDLREGFDRLLAVGVRGSLSPTQAAASVEALFEGHHYTGGWAFLPQGTPTNNTETLRSSYPAPDPDGAISFAVERGTPLDRDGGDGRVWTQAMGLDPNLIAHVRGADGLEQERARAMSRALWPVTFGYFLRHLMAPHVGEADIDAVRAHHAAFVRGRGPLPAFRIGQQPYGVLPVSSLERWSQRPGARPIEATLAGLLQKLWSHWLSAAESVPRVGQTDDPDADLMSVLGLHPSSRLVRIRTAHGPDWEASLRSYLDAGPTGRGVERMRGAHPLMKMLGAPMWWPRVLEVIFGPESGRYRHPLVAAPVSETDPLTPDYVSWIRTATLTQLRDQMWPGGSPPVALLYRVLRHARLVEIARAALDVAVAHRVAEPTERLEPELVGVTRATRDRPALWDRLQQPIPDVSGSEAIGSFLISDRSRPESEPIRELDAALEVLEGVPSAELERLFTETLDVSSHRLDAWITSLATGRLHEMRSSNPVGVHVGAYGWVEDLRPRGQASTSHGFVQAPSLDHAAAASVLYSGYLTRGSDSQGRYAIDLSSAKVRAALEILDALRQGQTLGAVLGARFERSLRDNSRSLMHFVEPLRERFPLVARKSEPTGAPAKRAAGQMVVDGVALRAAFLSDRLDLEHRDFSTGNAARDAADREAVVGELRALDTLVDATSDLLLAESVYQTVSGNASSSGASLDALARGTVPPEPAIAQQPRPGVPVFHRVAILLGETLDTPPGWPEALTLRAEAEPALDVWLGQRLGDPRRVRARVVIVGPEGETETTHAVTLAELGLRPLDVLFLPAPSQGRVQPTSELDHRIADVALPGGMSDAAVRIDYNRDPSWDGAVLSFPELLELAHRLRTLLGASRPLGAADLVPPSEAQGIARDLLPELSNRSSAALGGLEEVIDRMDAAGTSEGALREALRAAGQMIAGAYPGASVLDAHAQQVAEDLERRRAAAIEAADPMAALAAIFGEGFPVLPRFVPANPDELDRALQGSHALVNDERAPRRWLAQAGRVREKMQLLSLTTTLSESVASSALQGVVIQLPVREGDHWVALEHGPDEPPAAGSMGLLILSNISPSAGTSWAGMVVDEWPEVIPDPRPSTGVTFHFDTPGTEAPQCLLLAVPPRHAETWELDDVLAILNESLDLARIRAVDGTALGELARLLPTAYLAANAANDTVSTSFVGDLAARAVIADDVGGNG